ncbi:hypothetical protein BCR34DRAFT_305537 [Clohesyomyces aquaticus]|uniref:Uncharacterized protein n=1 Tax=Clohesyomyces aquaticus TaxID=1231657 RepID=A0A1Y1ZPR4_9PLEO|nr:hypothetical protein BCR34DRAFT_305537 [Clohesyomyces aquaticus]
MGRDVAEFKIISLSTMNLDRETNLTSSRGKSSECNNNGISIITPMSEALSFTRLFPQVDGDGGMMDAVRPESHEKIQYSSPSSISLTYRNNETRVFQYTKKTNRTHYLDWMASQLLNTQSSSSNPLPIRPLPRLKRPLTPELPNALPQESLTSRHSIPTRNPQWFPRKKLNAFHSASPSTRDPLSSSRNV